MTVDDLAQEIRRIDGNHSLGAGALAEALMPFISAALPHLKTVAAAPQPAGTVAGIASMLAVDMNAPLNAIDRLRCHAAGNEDILFEAADAEEIVGYLEDLASTAGTVGQEPVGYLIEHEREGKDFQFAPLTKADMEAGFNAYWQRQLDTIARIRAALASQEKKG